jgi:transcriptional regulator with GAF, ATPase, and Fis domain
VRNSKVENPGLDAGLSVFTEFFDEIHLPALPDTLIESELFGYKKGAFTDAKDDRAGLLGGFAKARREFEYKDLLLDEIGDASPALQAKLLQVVEHRRFRPVGSAEYYDTSARLLMATNRDLGARVKEGRFREDLHWRLREFVVVVPPLREQPENIEPIARQIESTLRTKMPGTEAPLSLAAADMEWARTYEWPGNVRELRHAIVRWFFAEGNRSLEQVVRELQAEAVGSRADTAALIASLVRARIDAALREKRPPGSLDALVKEFAREVKGAVHDWYRAEEPGDDLLQLLFPDSKPNSVRNKLSTWRRR